VRDIKRVDYEREVVEGSAETWVVLHLYQDCMTDCAVMDRALTDLARRHKATKFLRIKATEVRKRQREGKGERDR
jgi:hypothetical protein